MNDFSTAFLESAIRAKREIERVSGIRVRPLGPLPGQVVIGPLSAHWCDRWADTVPIDPLYESECNASPHIDPLFALEREEARERRRLLIVLALAVVCVVATFAYRFWVVR